MTRTGLLKPIPATRQARTAGVAVTEGKITYSRTRYGFGKMLLPMAVRQARNEVPESCQRLKLRLESNG